MNEFSTIGKRIPRIDGIPLATGEARFASDIFLPRMLYGKILRSRFPHARILRIDTSRAERLEGVKAVVTAQDTPKIKYTFMAPSYEDKIPLCDEKVKYLYDEVAAVAAVSEEIAEEALGLIDVEYEELPSIFDPSEAMKPDAPLIHADKAQNVAAHPVWEFGNVEEGFRQADFIFENTFTVQPVSHGTLETNGCVAAFDTAGNLTLWTSTQAPYFVRWDLAHIFEIPIEKIRVRKVMVGAGFGSKSRIKEVDAIAVLLARKSRRPVKIIYTREENMSASRSRHPMVMRLRTGVKKDGTLVARHVETLVNDGAYNDVGQDVATLGGLGCVYRCPNIKLEGYAVYTNNPFGGRYRAFHGPSMRFALESELDMIAEKLGIDSVEMRLKNAVEAGYVTPLRGEITSCGLKECIQKAAEAVNWKEWRRNKKPYRGIGMACLAHVSGGMIGDTSSVMVKVSHDKVTVLTGAVEVGGGQDTIIAQFVAEELGVPIEDIKVLSMDSEFSPHDLGSRASRFTFHGGLAAKAAAADAKAELFKLAAEKLEASADDLEMKNGFIFVKGAPSKVLHYLDVATRPGSGTSGGAQAKYGRAILGKGVYAKNPGVLGGMNAMPFGVQVAEVEVDPETGVVTVLKFVNVSDIGRAINPMFIEGQVEGGIVQGMGYALTEELIREKGKTLNPNFRDYKMPTAMDAPVIENYLVETNDPIGPFGAKSIGEATSIPSPGAIANAVYDAIGVRIKDLPITPEKILKALKNEQG